MSTVNIQSQKLSTNWVAQLFQFRFPAGNTVYLANALEWQAGWSKFYNGQYDYVEIEMSVKARQGNKKQGKAASVFPPPLRG